MKIFIGFIIGVMFVIAGLPAIEIANDKLVTKNEDLHSKIEWSVFKVKNLEPFKVFKEWCTKDVRKNGHGWIFIKRDFFGCNKLEIAISDILYGELTKDSREDLRKDICTNCKL